MELPPKYRIHNVFHASLLEPYDSSRGEQYTTPDIVNGEEEWEVEQILSERITKEGAQFMVKWKNWPAKYNQWVSQQDLSNASELLQEFKDNTVLRHHHKRGRPKKHNTRK